MKSHKVLELIRFVENNYQDVRVIGVQNPSVIVTVNGKSYVIFKPYGQSYEGKYVICIGEDRFYIHSVEEIKTIVK